MARIDKDLIILIGRDRENPRTHREAFEITDGLGEMLDKHIKRNNLNKSEFIREAVAAKLEAEMLKEPLIKDEKIRKAVRAWAELNKSKQVVYVEYTASTDYCCLADMDNGCYCIKFVGRISALKDGEEYTIDEICGEEEECES